MAGARELGAALHPDLLRKEPGAVLGLVVEIALKPLRHLLPAGGHNPRVRYRTTSQIGHSREGGNPVRTCNEVSVASSFLSQSRASFDYTAHGHRLRYSVIPACSRRESSYSIGMNGPWATWRLDNSTLRGA